MPATNMKVADAFDEIADLLEIGDANPFRVRAYRNAARMLRGTGRDVGAMVTERADLAGLPGIGEDLAAKIGDIVRTGTTDMLEQLRASVPRTLTQLLALPGVGPKRVKLLHEKLGIDSPDDLRRAAGSGKLAATPGLGKALQAKVLQALEARAAQPAARTRLDIATAHAEALVAHLRKAQGALEVIAAGSLRRGRETVGDIDILATATAPAKVTQAFIDYPDVRTVLAHGPTRSTVVLTSGLQVDLRVVARESYGAALYYFTGSKAHNIAVRRRAVARGLKINEYGVFRGEKRIAGDTEESVFRAVGLPYIAPELREDRGEIDAALKGALPTLVERRDLRGDLHVHTDATDGRDNLADMAAAARAAGLTYIAVTDHSRRLTVARGLDTKRLRRQLEAIDRFNEAKPGITVLKGIEVDILEDGSLDLPDSLLRELDIVVGAIHSQFGLDRARQTARILKAMDRPSFTLLAHPLGRLIGEREAYDVDMTRIIRHARERGCFLELNAQPERLDLPDIHCQAAKEEGVLVAINSDAHAVPDFAHLRYGVLQARRGWLAAADVLNTRSLAQLRKLLARTIDRRQADAA